VNPILTPTLAVLPAVPEAGLLAAAVGATDDFMLLPLRAGEWRCRIERLLTRPPADLTPLSDRLSAEHGLANLVGQGPAFRRTRERIPLLAKANAPVFITGETGTGKELCARAIHHLSRRKDGPFIPVDCAAFPDQLFENEIFGHARGAFTDAHRDQKGLIAMAERGTLFLDEIDALSLAGQAKLLRFLQEKTYKPLGAERFQNGDVRVLAATNQDVEALVARGRFRSDLYFRLNVLQLQLSPLRERREDIEGLARHFIDLCCAENHLPHKTLTPAALRALAVRDWPGNIREISNIVQRAVLLSGGTKILVRHLSPEQMEPGDGSSSETGASGFREARARAVASFERVYVEQLLRKHDGNVTRAAREAQKDRRVFGRLAKKYQIHRRQIS
jgi:DNA-binding NtrC family response regulator